MTPWVYKITDSKSIVLKSVYENLRNNRDELQLRLDQERDNKAKLETKIKNLENELVNLRNNKENSKNIEGNLNVFKLENEVDIIYEKLKEQNLIEKLFFLMNDIRENKNWFTHSEKIKIEYFINLGLLEITERNHNGVRVDISRLGEKILRKTRLEYL